MPERRTPKPRPTKHHRQGARLLALFLNSGDVPDFITDAALRAVNEAEEATGIEAIRLDAGGTDEKALAELLAVVPWSGVKLDTDAATVTAERLADLLEAPETPRVLRDLLCVVCESIDTAAADVPEGEEHPAFAFPHGDKLTPALIRRELPAMLRKVGDWRPDAGLVGIARPKRKGGGR
jgi:hypothetical protein